MRKNLEVYWPSQLVSCFAIQLLGQPVGNLLPTYLSIDVLRSLESIGSNFSIRASVRSHRPCLEPPFPPA